MGAEFNAQKEDGGWMLQYADSEGNCTRKIVVKDNELVKQFKEFVEQSKTQVLNEG